MLINFNIVIILIKTFMICVNLWLFTALHEYTERSMLYLFYGT